MEKNGRMRILLIMELLIENTDAQHGVGMQDILTWLEEHQTTGARKSVYEDIHVLQEYGLDIRYYQKDKTYRMVSRLIDGEELALFIRAIRSADFISDEKAEQMIEHIQCYVNRFDREQVVR